MTSSPPSDRRPSSGEPARQRHGLLWDALQIGSRAWSMGIVAVTVGASGVGHIEGLPRWLRVLVALTPLVPIAMYLRSTSQTTAKVDELALHIRREAYGFAFWALIGIIVCVQLLQNAGLMPGFNWGPLPLVSIMLALLVAGAVISHRRYH